MCKVIKTVGDLKSLLQNLSDDTLLLSYQSDMEKSGYVNRVFVDVLNMSIKEKKTYDAFDHTPYNYKVYERDSTGEQYIVFG